MGVVPYVVDGRPGLPWDPLPCDTVSRDSLTQKIHRNILFESVWNTRLPKLAVMSEKGCRLPLNFYHFNFLQAAMLRTGSLGDSDM